MNIKQIRTLVFVGLLIFIGGGGIVIFYSKTSSPALNIGMPSTITPSAADESINTREDEYRAINEVENTIAPRPTAQDAVLRARALEIINMPIVIKSAISPESKKQAEEKIAVATKMIRENYNHDLPWLELASYRQVLGDFDGAIAALDFLSTIRPKGYVSFHNLGVVYGFYLKNYPEAEENFLKSIANNPQNIDAYSQLVAIYETYKPEKIELLLLEAIKKSLDDAPLKIMLGQYYAKIGKKTEAIQYLEEALKLNPTNAELKVEIEELKN